MKRLGAYLGIAATLGVLAVPSAALADSSPEQALADRYAPVLRLVEQPTPCGDGEPYTPMSVDPVLGNPEVALRGSWTDTNLVKVAPTAADIAVGLPEYHLDFPGNALRPKCTYEEWQHRLKTVPTTYAHVVSEDGQTSLQYWFFYIYNDYNDRHEADWEMIQLDFPAATAAEAVSMQPAEVGYSQHNGAERARWGDPKLELAGSTHPIVYPAAGSHADYFAGAVYLGRSAAQGVGCDNTHGPWREVTPAVNLVPSDAAAAQAAYPWLGFKGFWGERQAIYNNGPTGPSAHRQWDHPIVWSQTSWHPAAFPIPGAVTGGPSATNLFCTSVGAGSTALNLALNGGSVTLLVLFGGVIALLVAIIRANWKPSQPHALARRRGVAQTLAASARMYRLNGRAFLAIGALYVPVAVLTALVQNLVFALMGLNDLTNVVGPTNPAIATVVVVIAVTLALIALTFVQAMVAATMPTDAGTAGLGARAAYRSLRPQLRSLLAALGVAAGTITVLLAIPGGVVVAVWLLVRWSLFAQCIVLEDLSWRHGLRRSFELVRGRWWRTATTLVVAVGVALLLGPAFGMGMLLVSPIGLGVVNLIAGVVYTLAIPFAAIATTYLYYDLRVRRVLDRSAVALDAEAVLD
jgi:hypothetical protein